MPSRMCINPIHNKKGILHQSSFSSSEDRSVPYCNDSAWSSIIVSLKEFIIFTKANLIGFIYWITYILNLMC